MTTTAVPVLAYHGYNISGKDYGENDHVALAADLQWLTEHGWTIVSLERIVMRLFDGAGLPLPQRSIGISFDDGTDLDWWDVEFGALGSQRSLHGILADHHRTQPELPPPHATSFVIGSPDARSILAERALQHGHTMGDDWWQQAHHSSLISIGNHSWDHRHPLVVPSSEGESNFLDVDNYDEAVKQVVDTGDYIGQKIGVRPTLFAYPWGQASTYLRSVFFPEHRSLHGCIAAFSTEAGLVCAGSDRWFLPRFVCNHHWRSQDELAQLLSTVTES